MSTFFEELEPLRREEPRAVLATLVATRGTSPRQEGARMWVGERGRVLGSVTIGGCVDGHVLHAAEAALAGGRASLLSVDLGDEDAHALGLTCAGAVDVLVQPVDLRRGPWLEALEHLRQRLESGERAALAMVLPVAKAQGGGVEGVDAGDGPPAGSADEAVSEGGTGPPLVVGEDGSVRGSTGRADLDGRIRERALERLRLGGAGVDRVEIAGAGSADVYIEAHGPGPLLAIVGAGPIAAHLATMGRMLGSHVVVIDGRARFADARQFPDAQEVIAGAPAGALRGLRVDASSAVVLVAHDYKFDLPVLREVLAGAAGYVGMLGSRKRVSAMLRMLEEEGIPREALDRVHAPIGLDIGGRGAGEIALSIAAEVVAARNGRSGGSLRGRAP
jgi:xanthine dehydrogenase accessory factor